MKIDQDTEDTHSNTTYVKVPVINYFNHEAEKVLGVFHIITQRLLQPKQLDNIEGEGGVYFMFRKNEDDKKIYAEPKI